MPKKVEKVEYQKMDPRWKEAWVAALRSGDYPQGRGSLSRDGKFCCLGVLCDIHPNIKWTESDGSGYRTAVVKRSRIKEKHYSDSKSESILPEIFRNAVKLDYNAQQKLASMNDGQHRSFKTIADWIEQNL